MREIKFRAWDIVHKEIVDVHELAFYPSGLLYSVNGRPSSDFELREFVGTTDKLGMEIYDKDVVEMRWRPIGKAEDRIRRFTVIFDKGSFKQLEMGEVAPGKWYAWSSLKIVGNVYESPELCG